jgi:hypothetical protein
MLGQHTIKTWSSTLASVSLSSGEAEFYGVVRATGMGLGYQSLLADLGVSLPLRVWTDSTAAVGICSRQGLGGQRHVDTHSLWVQQGLRSGRFTLHKVDGEVNPADLFTKHMGSRDKLAQLARLFGCKYLAGRSTAAPAMREAAGTKKTMAMRGELSALADDEVIVPHVFGDDYVNDSYPAIQVTSKERLDEDYTFNQDDGVFNHGTAIARKIMADAAAFGWLKR